MISSTPKAKTFKSGGGSGVEFELYLEGIKVPFSSLKIGEHEQGFPNAQVSFPATAGALRVLPSTMVQVFGPAQVEVGGKKT